MSASEIPKKHCTNCGGLGPFGRSKTAKDGLKSHCKKCCAEKQRAYAAANRHVWANWASANADRLKARDAARYAADPDGEKARVLAYHRKHPEKARGWVQKSLYGITPEEKQALFYKQVGKCAICEEPLTTGRLGMQIDHDHVTRKVRGLLCHPCNVMLGDFEEDTARLEAACTYLLRGLPQLPPLVRPPEAARAGTRASNLWYGYGLTEEVVRLLRDRQGGGCAICRTSLGPGAHIDHDHKLGRKAVRGLLCRACNLGLGHAREDVQILRLAAEYLTVRRQAAA